MASGTELLLCRVAAAPYPAYSPKSPLAQGLLKLPVLAASTSLRRSRKAGAARMDALLCWRLRLTRPTRPALTVSRPGKQLRRRAMASGTLLLCRVAAAPYPAYSPKSPLAQGLLKLPVLAASTSLRRSRKAGAARMDAG